MGKLFVDYLKCLEGTDELNTDHVYLVFFIGRNPPLSSPSPRAMMIAEENGSWNIMGTGDESHSRVLLTDQYDPNNLCLVALVECDDGVDIFAPGSAHYVGYDLVRSQNYPQGTRLSPAADGLDKHMKTMYSEVASPLVGVENEKRLKVVILKTWFHFSGLPSNSQSISIRDLAKKLGMNPSSFTVLELMKKLTSGTWYLSQLARQMIPIMGDGLDKYMEDDDLIEVKWVEPLNHDLKWRTVDFKGDGGRYRLKFTRNDQLEWNPK